VVYSPVVKAAYSSGEVKILPSIVQLQVTFEAAVLDLWVRDGQEA